MEMSYHLYLGAALLDTHFIGASVIVMGKKKISYSCREPNPDTAVVHLVA
jgi:hypothetical protein